uniref:Uncharacterized protein n=1 Tax=Oryza meridionalis TaxID=40149 RepID=A0A0E0EY57_9ORYZ
MEQVSSHDDDVLREALLETGLFTGAVSIDQIDAGAAPPAWGGGGMEGSSGTTPPTWEGEGREGSGGAAVPTWKEKEGRGTAAQQHWRGRRREGGERWRTPTSCERLHIGRRGDAGDGDSAGRRGLLSGAASAVRHPLNTVTAKRTVKRSSLAQPACSNASLLITMLWPLPFTAKLSTLPVPEQTPARGLPPSPSRSNLTCATTAAAALALAARRRRRKNWIMSASPASASLPLG